MITSAVAALLVLAGSLAARQDTPDVAAAEAELRRVRAAYEDADVYEVAVQTAVVGGARSRAGDRAGALEAYLASLEMARRLELGDHELIQAVLSGMGGTAAGLGRADETVAAYEEAIAMARRLWPEGHERMAESLKSYGASLVALGRPAEAEAPLREALALRQRLGADETADAGRVQQDLANCLLWLGRTAEAVEQLQAALEIYRRTLPPSHPTRVACRNQTGSVLLHLDRSKEALALYTVALESLRAAHPGDHTQVAAAMTSTANALSNLGRNGEAVKILEPALAMARRLHPGDDELVAEILNSMARSMERAGEAAEALPHFEAALAIRRRRLGDDHLLVAQSQNNLAFCLEALGRVDDAIPLHRETLALRRRLAPGDSPGVANSLQCLADALRSAYRTAEALPLIEEHVAMVGRLYGEDSPSMVTAWTSLAVYLGDLGREEEALAIGERALAANRRVFGETSVKTASALEAVAVSLANLGRLDEALARLEESLAIGRRYETGGSISTLMNLGVLLMKMDRPAEAVEKYAEAIARIEALRAAASGLGERDRARYFAHLRRDSNPYVAMAWAQVALGRRDEALRYLEQGRARTLLDLMERRRVDPLAEARRVARQRGDDRALDMLREVAAALDDARGAVERTTHELAAVQKSSELDDATRAGRVTALDAARTAALEEEREALRRRARAVQNQLPLGRPATPGEIRGLPEPGELLLVFAFTEMNGALFLVPPAGDGDVLVFGLEILPDELARTVAALQGAWSRPDGALDRASMPELAQPPAAPSDASSGATNELSHRLFRALFPADAWARIRAASQVYLIPTGPLHDIPVEAFTVGFEDGAPRYWIDDGPPVSYAPSATVLLSCRTNRGARRAERMPLEVLALGDPVYDAGHDDVAIPEAGALIVAVSGDSIAERAGLRVGDVVTGYDGAPVEDDRALRDRIQALGNAVEDGDRPAGTTPELRLVRDGEERAVEVATGSLGVEVARGAAGEAFRQGLASGDAKASVERAGMLLRYGDLAPLPGTRRELAALYESFTGAPFDPRTTGEADGVRLLLGEDANEAELFRHAPKARILHLAAHYLADETEFATRSALALTLPRVPSAQDDGFLSVGDVMERWRGRLDGCELVVLSACETARGERQRHEGVFAMPWGLFYAGVPAVIVSHWRVSDDSTAELMAEFYRLLRGEPGIGKLEAFTRARRAIRARYPAPFHWAPFVYLGEPR